MIRNLNFININLIQIFNMLIKWINFFSTHTYFYILMFAIQLLVIIFYLLVFFLKITQNIFLIIILKIIYFIHGIIGLLTIIDDYIFNNFIKIIYICFYYIISIKLFIILFENFIIK